MAASLPPVPVSLKQVNHYLKTAQEHDKRDPVIAYYCRMFALERCLEIDKSSPEAKTFLYALMDYLEQSKAALKDHDAISSETVGQAHVENYALKMFAFADTEDRASRHTKNVVKSFYTAGMLFDVLTFFGEIGDMERYQKYAKYKSAYIHKCLKAGIAPFPGPVDEDGEDLGFGDLSVTPGGSAGAYNDQSHHQPPAADTYQQPPAASYQPPAASYEQPTAASHPEQSSSAPAGGQLNFEVDWAKATKYSKFATSSLGYMDREGAIEYLQKALNLLTVGHE